MLKKIYDLPKYFATIRYLKLPQVFFTLKKNIPNKNHRKFNKYNLEERPENWKEYKINISNLNQSNNHNFLNLPKKIKFPEDWHTHIMPKLWQYNLHYFDYLNSASSNIPDVEKISLIDSWIKNNQFGIGVGWEPYPISLRSVNWIKAYFNGLNLKGHHFDSLYSQIVFLFNNLEKHLLGNHYFSNLKALIFAGILFENKTWIKKALRELKIEISEQFYKDGANFELSPMYHGLAVIDLLDIYNLLQSFPNQFDNEIKEKIEILVPKAIRFLEDACFNDVDLGFFNDSCNNVLPAVSDIKAYCATLGFKSINTNTKDYLRQYDCGYMVARKGVLKLIFDAANVGPDYIPGHAHADTLSFEMSANQKKVFVNSGISTYDESEIRNFQRGTSAHNTVEIDGKNSSMVWKSFRVGNRAKIINRSSKVLNDGTIFLLGKHDGYRSLGCGAFHQREIFFDSTLLTVLDRISGSYKNAYAFFYFHPDFKVEKKDNIIQIYSKELMMEYSNENFHNEIIKSQWFPEFNKSFENLCLKVKIVKPTTEHRFKIKLK